jgi:hypothetical protein
MKMQELVERVKDFIRSRQTAYLMVFRKEDKAVEMVLKDLAKFCRANKTCFHEDERIHANLEGRREVFLRIMEHINLTPDEYWDKYGRER